MKPLVALGLLLAVLAEACSVGLLGLSGWFIAASAVAGAATYSSFSYLAPSGGVRAFALGRIATGYAARVVLHAAALRRISNARLAVYDRTAASEVTGWSGQSLDRVMAGADTVGMALIQATTPAVVTAVMTAGGCIAIGLAGYPLVALALAIAVITCALLAAAAARRMVDSTHAQALLRTELVSAVEAWPELASLGATAQLSHRTLRRFAAFEDRADRHAATEARALGSTRAVTAAALLLTVLLAAWDGAGVATLVYVALLAAGVLANAEHLVSAMSARARSRQAEAYLASVSDEDPEVPTSFRARYDGHSLTVAGFRLPETPTRGPREVGFTVAVRQTIVITGPSGSGKTTLVTAIAAALRQQPAPGVITAALADDHLFTGTVAGNIRLANPAASDAEIADLLAAMELDRLEPHVTVGVGGRTVSGGEQRRLQLARALATRPDVLLIDEPTTGLDAATAALVLRAVRRRLPEAILVVAMHEPPSDPQVLGSDWFTAPVA